MREDVFTMGDVAMDTQIWSTPSISSDSLEPYEQDQERQHHIMNGRHVDERDIHERNMNTIDTRVLHDT